MSAVLEMVAVNKSVLIRLAPSSVVATVAINSSQTEELVLVRTYIYL